MPASRLFRSAALGDLGIGLWGFGVLGVRGSASGLWGIVVWGFEGVRFKSPKQEDW